jgi:hypothetical protein
MQTIARALHRLSRAALFAAVIAAGAVSGAHFGSTPLAHADEEAPVQVGTQLVARSDFELQKVVIPRGSKVEVTALPATNSVDVALPDGAVLHRVPLARIRYFFDVVR